MVRQWMNIKSSEEERRSFREGLRVRQDPWLNSGWMKSSGEERHRLPEKV